LNYNTKISVKCINRENLIDPIDGTLLTKGKFYDLLEVETEENVGIYGHQSTTIYWIIDDTGKKRCYDGMRFDPNPLALKRLLLLSELGISE
jgi:hypothetical protein